jgi:putative ABC transport system permease protein
VIKISLRALWGRKLRTVLTALAIVLGVATVSGTYVLTDSISGAFDQIFSSIYNNTDAVVTGKSAVSKNSTTNLPSFDESLLDKVREQSTVAAAIGGVADASTNLIDKKGKVISFGGAPHLGFSVDPKYPAFSSLTLLQGAWPKAGEVVIDHGTAGKKHIAVGDRIKIEAQSRATWFRVSGLVKFGSSNLDIGGATLAGFDIPTAQKLFNKVGKLDQIRISKKPGVTEAALLAQLKSFLRKEAPQTRVRSGAQQAKTDASDTKSFTDFLQTFLLAFGGVALFVGAFVIANSLSITIAQRTREFATLRTIGASRRQIRRVVLLESTVMGVLASVVGLFLGLGLAKLLFWLFDTVGFTLPNTGLLFETRTIIVALAVGILVTIIASLRPAFRATRVPPIAAVREGSTLPPGRFASWRPYLSATLAILGFASFAYALFGSDLSTTQILVFMGIGAGLIFFGVALFSSALVVPLATVIGWPGARVGGAPGVLARENSQRNPQRTGSTAAALMIGLALVTLVAMLASGIRASFFGAVDKLATADYAVTAQNNFDPIPVATEQPIRRAKVSTAVVGVREADVRMFKATHSLTGITPGGSRVLDMDWIAGPGQVTFETLGADGAFVDKTFAKDHKLQVGSKMRAVVPSGESRVFVVHGIFKPPPGGSPFGPVTISSKTFDSLYTQPQDLFIFANTIGDVTDQNTKRLDRILRGFPNAKVQTISQFKTNQAAGLDAILNVLYVLLALSVIVSLFGIVNTLVLTVFERTRELGMLRAVGMTRRQVRRMIRYESVITALIGAAIGIALGIVLAVLLIARVDFIVLSWPVTSLIVFALVAVVAGLIAAILPARRASRLNVLEALQYE